MTAPEKRSEPDAPAASEPAETPDPPPTSAQRYWGSTWDYTCAYRPPARQDPVDPPDE